MKIKTKLLLGVGLLFIMIALLTTLGLWYINQLSGDSKNILTDNYNTIDYCRQMLNSLNKDIADTGTQADFRANLLQQKNTITETGERELTDKLEADFNTLIRTPADSLLQNNIRHDLMDIMLLNMQAIQRKSGIAGQTAESAVFWISITGVICFILAFTMLVNLPGNIANPIKELTTSIKQIAAQNYSERVHFEQHNEFGELAAAFNTMAGKLQEYQAGSLEKLMMEKKRIETLINNMSEPVIGLDNNRYILFMNNTALQVAGLQQQTVIGKPVQEIAAKNDLVKTLTEELFNPAAATSSAPVKIYANNKESYFEKEIIPIRIIPTGEKEEKHIGDVIMLQNITPYKELDFAKTNFIATVSHELKTPISAIKMSLQLLENKQIGTLNAEQQDLVESIRDDAGRLLKITGELLNMTQVESGSIHINITPTDVQEIIHYAVNANKTAAEQKQISINIKAGTPVSVFADSEKTAWVLTNLLSNAIRYSHDHSTIDITVQEENDKVKFTVTDTGQGIPPEYIDKVFDRYFRIPGTKKEGTGLGLSISKEFIEAQGGTISATSDFGAGSTFSFWLKGLYAVAT